MAVVLVVDDEADIRDVMRLNLEGVGHQVLTAADGEQALSAARDHAPDAIFLDVLMPGVDGWAVLERLKSGDDRLAGVPVIMVTALSQPEERVRGGIEGAVRYLTKPFHPRDLLGALDSVLDGDAPPEAELRRRARQEALELLASLEAGSERRTGTPRVRLTRLEHRAGRVLPPALPEHVVAARERLVTLTPRQHELLQMLRASGSVTDVAAALGQNRNTVFANLRRVVHRLGLRDTSELLSVLADGHLIE